MMNKWCVLGRAGAGSLGSLGSFWGSLGSFWGAWEGFFEVLEVVTCFCCAGAILCASFQQTRGVVSAVVRVEKLSLVEFS